MFNKTNKILNKSLDLAVIGSGFSGLSASSYLAAHGHKVTLYEKNIQCGGRARTYENNGFIFDMGPSWYWMPDVFERFYNCFGHTASDFYKLIKLDPGFTIIFGKDDAIDIPANFQELCSLFESIEEGSAEKLRTFMKEAEHKYSLSMGSLVFNPGLTIREYITFDVLKEIFRLQLFSSFKKHVRAFFKNPRLLALIEFPILFLGAMPESTPALYSLMNYAGLKQGTLYPMGGFGKVVKAFKTIAEEQGVTLLLDNEVECFNISSGKIVEVESRHGKLKTDGVIGAADCHHVENDLLAESERSYSNRYWEKRKLAPSALLFFLGINKKIDHLNHHNLFFDEDIDKHANDIHVAKKWPEKPLFYVCAPSKTDPAVAPDGCENLFVLMPIASGLKDSPDKREYYFNLLIERIENFTGNEIRNHIIEKRSYCISDFAADYHAYKGNAYGLANTLYQTAIFKPKMKSKKVDNLFFAGQLTVPGPGVPPAIISGEIAANQLLKYLNQ
ncbi:MAG: phytoene desaturase [Chitinophagales bacterium]|nr:phytoene desaturase [Chitinophagales bacterium]